MKIVSKHFVENYEETINNIPIVQVFKKEKEMSVMNELSNHLNDVLIKCSFKACSVKLKKLKQFRKYNRNFFRKKQVWLSEERV